MPIRYKIKITWKNGEYEEIITDSYNLNSEDITGIIIGHYPTVNEITMLPYANMESYEIEPIKER